MMNDLILSKHVEQTKNCGIKIDYKNCASRWSLTQQKEYVATERMHLSYGGVLISLYINRDII